MDGPNDPAMNQPSAMPAQPPPAAPDRNLAMELVRVTEAAAMAAGRWVGKGQKESADQAAVDAMRLMLDTVAMDGVVVIGEGEKDEAPMLYNGEALGSRLGPKVDVAVDPLEGTNLTARGAPGAIAVVAVAERGTMFFPGAAVYMDKICAGPEACQVIDIEAPPGENVRKVAKAKGIRPDEVSVVVLDRERHQQMIADLRESHAQVLLITDGDVAPSVAAAWEGTGVDLLMGVGGTPEGVISAAALKCLGGGMQGKLWPRNDAERKALLDAGYDIDEVLDTDRLVGGQDVFVAATGVTTGSLLDGVRYTPKGAVTDSIVMRSRSGTVRRIEATHALDKLMRFSQVVYR
jgi:fructose-1,6-bisphosphatase II